MALITEPRTRGSIVLIHDGRSGFHEGFSLLLDKRLGLMDDSDRDDILEKLALEFRKWVAEPPNGIRKADKPEWPYQRLAYIDTLGITPYC